MLGILTVVASLPAAADNGWISGYVKDSPFLGDPISGATVSTSTGGFTATTNATGYYNMSVPEGNYTVKAVATGFLEKTYSNISVTANNTTRQDFALAKPTGNLTGKITDQDDGSAISYAMVDYDDILIPAMTDSSGKYTLSGIPVGTYTFNVTAIGYPNASFTATITAGQTTTKDVQLKITTYVSVFVKTSLGLPISDAKVTCGNASGTTDILGMVRLDVTPGTYTLKVSKTGYGSVSKSITVTKGPNSYEASMGTGGAEEVGFLAAILALGCLILMLPLIIIIVVIVIIIWVYRRSKKAKAAAAQAAVAPAYPAQGAPPPGQAPPPMPPPGPPIQ